MLRISQFCECIDYHDLDKDTNKTIIYSGRTLSYVSIEKEAWDKIKEGFVQEIDNEIKISLIKYKILVDDSEDELLTLTIEKNLSISKPSVLYYAIKPLGGQVQICGACNINYTNNLSLFGYEQHLLKKLENKITSEHQEIVILWIDAKTALDVELIKLITPKFRALAQEYNLNFYSEMLNE